MLTIAKRITDTIPDSIKDDDYKKEASWIKFLAEVFLLVIEIVMIILKSAIAVLDTIFRTLFPPTEKTLFNEIVLITGSGHGIGRELAIQMATYGSTVVCWDKDEINNIETCKLIKSLGFSRVHAYTCDVTKRDEVLSMAKKVEEEVGNVTILINNAGVMYVKPFQEQDPVHIRRVFDVNVLAHFWTLEAFLPDMKKKNSGHIVAIGSLCGLLPFSMAVPYCASKFAVTGLMDTLYEEMRLTDPECHIKLTTIYPFTVDTGLVKKPRVRFPKLTPILTPDEVAVQVVKALKQERREMTVPSSMMAMARVGRILPRKLMDMGRDFFEVGAEAE